MESLNLNNSYDNSFQAQKAKAFEKVAEHNTQHNPLEGHKVHDTSTSDSKIHNSAINLSISMESIKVFLNIKSIEFTQQNTNAQNSLMNIINNVEVYDFLSGKELDSGFSLKSIGYEGKAITELSSSEAKELLGDEGFFGVSKTSDRVSAFAIDLAANDVDALQEVRKGLVQGFEEAQKLWGGELPEISHKTQERTLKIVDEKIAELLKSDFQKEVENRELGIEE